jgi:hypothetical protein
VSDGNISKREAVKHYSTSSSAEHNDKKANETFRGISRKSKEPVRRQPAIITGFLPISAYGHPVVINILPVVAIGVKFFYTKYRISAITNDSSDRVQGCWPHYSGRNRIVVGLLFGFVFD